MVVCPECGAEMRLRTAKKGSYYAGKQFYGCTRYPDCKSIVNINNAQKSNAPAGENRDYIDFSACNFPVKLEARTRAKGLETAFFDSVALPTDVLSLVSSERLSRQSVLDYAKWRMDYALPSDSKKLSDEQLSHVSIVEKIINRGRVTKLSPSLEKKLLSVFGSFLRKPDFNGITDGQIVATYASYNTPHIPTQWLDGERSYGSSTITNEEDCYRNLLLPAMGIQNIKDILPQVTFDSLVYDKKELYASTLSRRIDFLVTHGLKSIAIEIDDATHVGHDDKDNERDAILQKNGYKTFRITTSELSQRSGRAKELQEFLEDMYYDIATTNSQDVLPVLNGFKLAHQFQMAIVHLVKVGKINPARKTTVYFEYDNIPGLEPKVQEKVLDAALDDLKKFDSVLCRLYGIKPLFDNIAISNTNPSILFSVNDNQEYDVEKVVYLQEISFPLALEQNHNTGLVPLSPIQKNIEENLTYMLKYIFGFDEFRPNQIDGIIRSLSGQDSIILLPTGSGKSVVYQLASLLMPGISIIIDPIVSLINDQVDNLMRNGIDRVLGMSASTSYRDKVQMAISHGSYEMIYIAPERFQIEGFRNAITKYCQDNLVALCAIDEAHCVSEWGHDFRTSYLNLASTFRRLLKTNGRIPPVLALTGTASPSVLKDMQRDLKMNDDCLIRPESFDRKEITFDVLTVDSSEKKEALDKILTDILPEKLGKYSYMESYKLQGGETNCGIVFCPWRSGEFGVDPISKHIRELGIDSTEYYGKKTKYSSLTKEEWNEKKTKNAARYKNNDASILVATKSFGMGIDKPNIRFTIHYGLPESVESYYQEAGRAGRDRKPAFSYIILSNDFPERNRQYLDPEVRDLGDVSDFMKRKKRSDEDDITRAMFFHTESFCGVDEELKRAADVVERIGGVTSAKTVTLISGSGDKDRNAFEKIIYRLRVLGIVKDYTIDYANNEFKLEVRAFDKNQIYRSFFEYISGYQEGEFATSEANKLSQIMETDPDRYVVEAMRRLIEFIYEIIEKGRRRALSSLVSILGSSATEQAQDKRSSAIKKQVLDYLGNIHVDLLGKIVDDTSSIDTAYKAIKNSKTRERNELAAEASRILQAYPYHPGLLFVVGVLGLSGHDPDSAVSDLASSYQSAVSRYNIPLEKFLEKFIPAVCEMLETLPDDKASVSLFTLIDKIGSQDFIIRMADELPQKLRSIPTFVAMKNIASKLNNNYERRDLWKGL